MNTALVCMAKNEEYYIQEWITYHHKLGFNNIIIYANDWNYLNTSQGVKVIRFNGSCQQTKIYNSFLNNYSKDYNWVAFFDVDEFLVLKQHNNIQSFLTEYEDCNAIGINWCIFGNNNHTKVINDNYNVLSRFTRRNKELYKPNEHIKTIVKIPTSSTQDIHNVNGLWFNLNKEIRSGPFNSPVDWSVAQLNHYFTKSDEEFLLKCNRGRADIETKRIYSEYLDYLNANEIEDLTALNFFTQEKIGL